MVLSVCDKMEGLTLGVDLCILEVKICARAQINTLVCRKNEKLESVKKGM